MTGVQTCALPICPDISSPYDLAVIEDFCAHLVNVHEAPIACNNCLKTFSDQSEFENHVHSVTFPSGTVTKEIPAETTVTVRGTKIATEITAVTADMKELHPATAMTVITAEMTESFSKRSLRSDSRLR